MGTPYLGEIRQVSFNFAPRGWALCNGQLLPINQNQALFSILGTTYGGNGTTNFALPNLQGRAPVHFGTNQGSYSLGQVGGESAHTLTTAETPAHTHALNVVSGSGNAVSPGSTVTLAAVKEGTPLYASAAPNAQLTSTSLSAFNGGSQAHPNLPPYLVINYVIALQGIFPSRN